MPPSDTGLPLISIVTVCKNEVHRIRETCESIVNQSMQDFEWIVLDGGSTDGTLDVLSKYRYRMTFYRTGPDGGIYAAMNEGVRRAKGEYCLFLNGGDSLFSNQSLSALMPYIHRKYDVIVGDVWFDEIRARPYYPARVTLLSLVIYGLPHPSSLIRTVLIKDLDGYDEVYRVAADLDLFFRLRRKKRARFLRAPVIVSRFHVDGVSSTETNLSHEEMVTVWRKNLPYAQFWFYGKMYRNLRRGVIVVVKRLLTAMRSLHDWRD